MFFDPFQRRTSTQESAVSYLITDLYGLVLDLYLKKGFVLVSLYALPIQI